MVKEERAKGRAGIDGEGDMWNHFPYPCPSGTAYHKKLFTMKKSENANGHEAIRRKKKVRVRARRPFTVRRSPSCARACMATVQARSPAMRDRASEQRLNVLIVMPLSLGEGPEGR